MVTRILNLLLASAVALMVVPSLFEAWRHLDAMGLVCILVVVCWLAGAIGLFFGSRLAWCGSLLGVGTMLAFSLMMAALSWRLMPTARDPTDGIGYIMTLAKVGVLISGAVMFGLIRLRKELAGKWK